MIDGQYVKLGYYDTQSDNLTWLNKEKWNGKHLSFFKDMKIIFKIL